MRDGQDRIPVRPAEGEKAEAFAAEQRKRQIQKIRILMEVHNGR